MQSRELSQKAQLNVLDKNAQTPVRGQVQRSEH